MSVAGTRGIRFQPDETPAGALSICLGLQIVILSLAGVILIPTIVMRAGGASESYLSWAVFATVTICGATTVLHAIRVWRIGSGHLVVMGPTGVYIGVCIAAVVEGGPALLASLVVVSSALPFMLAVRLPLLQRLLIPTLSAPVLMLIPVTVMPAVFGLLTAVPAGTSGLASPLSALAVLLAIAGIMLKVTGATRLWAPVFGVAAGSAVAAAFGLYDMRRVNEAPWIGFPTGEWTGLDLQFGPAFWALLPTFLLVTIIASLRTVGGAVAIQRVSWRRQQAVDVRAVQGAVTVDGLGNLLTGLAGTVPNAPTAVGASVTESTGVASRSVGIATGILLVAIAFLPKVLAIVLAIPGPVIAAYLGVLLAMIFVAGMRIAMRDGIDYRKGLIIGVSFWVGTGCQYGMIFPEQVSEIAGGLLWNGITTGGAVAILMTLFMELTKPRRSRIEMAFGTSAIPKIQRFLGAFAGRNGWGAEMAARLDAACEETLLTLLRQNENSEEGSPSRRLRLAIHREDNGAVVEFVVAAEDDNLQDRLALISEEPDATVAEREMSMRLLRRLSSSVHHQQYHGVDIVTVRVAAPVSDAD